MDVIDPHLETIGAAIRVAARRRSDRYQRRSRRVTMVALAAPFLLGGGSALAGAAGVGPLANQLAVFNSSSTAEPTIPASVLEIATQEATGLPTEGTPDTASARQLARSSSGSATVHAMRAGNRVCLTLAGSIGAIGNCIATLGPNNELAAQLGVVDSQAYVWGAVANDVTKVAITTASGETDATLGTNGFVAPVSQAQSECSITVTAVAPSGNTTTTLKPVPAVAGPTSARGRNDVQSGRVTDAIC